MDVRADLMRLFEQRHGILSRHDTDEVTLDNAVRAGVALRLFPQTYVDAARYRAADDRDRIAWRRRAALRYAGAQAAISHTTALDLWELHRQSPDEPVHVSVSRKCRLRHHDGLVIHHRHGFESAKRVWRKGLLVVSAADAAVDSWPLLPGQQRSGPVIEAVGRRLATPAELADAMGQRPKLGGAGPLRDLVELLAQGCHSHLEIWGALHVFAGPDMPAFKRQFPVKVGRELFHLDVFAEPQRVAFELDGAAWHGNQWQRERDIRRDALLATVGILVVRFSYARLMAQPEAVRREIRAILKARPPGDPDPLTC